MILSDFEKFNTVKEVRTKAKKALRETLLETVFIWTDLNGIFIPGKFCD